MLMITTPTHKQQDDVSCSKMGMGVTPKLYSLEAFWILQLFESSYFGNGTQIFLKKFGVHFPQYVRNEKIIQLLWKIMWKMKDSSLFQAEAIFQLIQNYWGDYVKFQLFSNFLNKTQVHALSKWLQRVWFCLITFLYQFTSDYSSGKNSWKKSSKLKKLTF